MLNRELDNELAKAEESSYTNSSDEGSKTSKKKTSTQKGTTPGIKS
jgi:hypothetical protein